MIVQPYLSVVIPAYNEEHRLGKTLEDIDRYLRGQSYLAEIIVVNDGSSDGTAALAARYQKSMPNLRLIDNKENHGKGWVVKQGMLEANGKYRLFTDADNSTSLDHIEKFWPHLCGTEENVKTGQECFDVVIGSIEIAGSTKEEKAGWHRRLVGHLSKFLIRAVALPGIYDSQRGFKCFSSQAARRVFARQTIWRWGFDIEILLIARRQGFKIKELPVAWKNLGESKVKASAYLSTLQELFSIRFKDLKGIYSKVI